ncbi:MAG TPA: type II CAAX endopeptidase family protein [Armatimonadota bacterium]|nr:type II CAAX endopeptidase family protein [Armatimonadota bacterium]
MASEESSPGSPIGDRAARRHESPALLIIGITLYFLVLALIWFRAGEREDNSSAITGKTAQLNTMITQTLFYMSLRGDAASSVMEQHAQTNALQVAKLWENVSAGYSEPHWQALTLLDAAALYGMANRLPAAHRAIERAASLDTPNAAAYRELLPLYAPSPHSITLSQSSVAILNHLSAGPLMTARNAMLAGNRSLAQRILRPGAMLGIRLMLLLGIFLLFGFALLLAAIIIYILDKNAIRTAVREARQSGPADVPWGVGTALIVLSVHLLFSAVLAFALTSLVNHFGWGTSSTPLVMSVFATLVSALIVLGIFLLTLGHKPWDWRVLGWQTTSRGVRYGLVTLLVILPIFWLVSVISGIIFQGERQTNPLIEYFLLSRNPWLQVYLLLAAVLMAPLVEETFFRGILFRAMGEHMSFWVAAFSSGLLFALAHGQLAAILPITVLGTAFAFLTRRTRSLWASAAAHATYNGMVSLVLLLISWFVHPVGG